MLLQEMGLEHPGLAFVFLVGQAKQPALLQETLLRRTGRQHWSIDQQ
jgi:hypothetical protein